MLPPLAGFVLALVPQSYAGQGPPVPEKITPQNVPPSEVNNLIFGDAVTLTEGAFGAGAPQVVGTISFGTGRSFVFEEQMNGMFSEVELPAPAAIAGQLGARFGDAIASETIGGQSMFAVGAPGADVVFGGTVNDAGTVHVFTGGAGSYAVTDTLAPFVPLAEAEFGAALAMRGDSAAVGAPATGTALSKGSLSPFDRIGGVYVPQPPLGPDGAAPSTADFGSSVAIDGDLMVVGAPGDDSVNAVRTGTVYVYERSGPGQQWLGLSFPDNKVVGAQVQSDNGFGTAVALAGDLLVVGSPFADDVGCVGCPRSGAVYVFQRQSGAFVQVQQLFASDAAAFARFGTSVAISDERVIVGAAGANGGRGSLYIFEGAPGSFVEVEELGGNSDAAVGADLGGAVAADGTRFVAGAPLQPGSGSIGFGASYVFEVEAILGTPESISLASGGTQTIYLRVGEEFGSNFYIVLFSEGESGIPLPSVTIPLSFDEFFSLSATSPNTGPFSNTFGVLDANGNAEAAFVAPPGSPAALAGKTLFTAVVVVDLLGNPVFANDLDDNSQLMLVP